jgi:hypothetical protein
MVPQFPNSEGQVPPGLAPEDYYFEGPYLVFTAAYHLKRGTCCGSGCRHCPYRVETDSDQTSQLSGKNKSAARVGHPGEQSEPQTSQPSGKNKNAVP